MGPLCAIGQAAGVTAALTTTLGHDDVREVESAVIRHVLHEQGAFVEGETDPMAANFEGFSPCLAASVWAGLDKDPIL